MQATAFHSSPTFRCSRNPLAFHILFATPLLVAFLAWWAFLHIVSLGADESQSIEKAKGLSNRNVLNKRLQILEELADIRRDEASVARASSADADAATAGSSSSSQRTVTTWLRAAASSLLLNRATMQTINTGATRKYDDELAAARAVKVDFPATTPASDHAETARELHHPEPRQSQPDVVDLERRLQALEERLTIALQGRMSAPNAATDPASVVPSGSDAPPTSGNGDSTASSSVRSANANAVPGSHRDDVTASGESQLQSPDKTLSQQL